uniref:Uncharacterized protein n=1 Tax=Tetranychus urticae TaxID=32264 RepID=T1KTT0_TETUR
MRRDKAFTKPPNRDKNLPENSIHIEHHFTALPYK